MAEVLIPPVVGIDEKPAPTTPKEPPICKLYNWCEINNHLYATRYEDHPRLGCGGYIRTTQLVWINRDVGMARTANTLYRLVGKEVPPGQ